MTSISIWNYEKWIEFWCQLQMAIVYDHRYEFYMARYDQFLWSQILLFDIREGINAYLLWF